MEINTRKLGSPNGEHTPSTLIIVSMRNREREMNGLLVIGGKSYGGANDRGLFSMLGKMSLVTRLAHLYSQKSSVQVVRTGHQGAKENTHRTRSCPGAGRCSGAYPSWAVGAFFRI